jgi:long-chain acyl-CoA synthetase
MTVLGFWNIARTDPSWVAVIEDDGTPHLAGDLLARVNQQTHALRSLGLRRGDAVAVCLGNRAEFLELYLAVLQSGWYFVPIPCGSAAAEIAQMLADCEARVFVFESAVSEAALAGMRLMRSTPTAFAVDAATGVNSWPAKFVGCLDTAPDQPIAGDRLAFTSGTTGVPRAVRRPLAGLTLESLGKIAAMHLNAVAGIRPRSGAVHLVSSPLYHSASLVWCADQLHLGHTISLMQKWAPEAMLARIEHDGVTSSLMVPTHFHRLLSLPDAVKSKYDVASLRHIVHTGAACSVPIKKRMLAWWGPVIFEVYGATEGAGTRVGPQEWLERPGTVGRAFGRIRVRRADGSACAAGETGTIHIKLGSQSFEYQRDEPKTRAAVADGYFTVGDVGYLDEQSYLFVCGRSSEVIISGGVNLYPAQIEAALVTHPAVRDVAVVGVPDAEWGEQVKAIVELQPGNEGGESLVEDLKSHCRSQLAALKCPRIVEFTAALPRSESGKLLRRQLRPSEPAPAPA